MYTRTNYRTKKQLIEAVKAGKRVTVYQPGGIFPGETDGQIVIEGPHYPEPHRWYARATIKNSVIIKVS